MIWILYGGGIHYERCQMLCQNDFFNDADEARSFVLIADNGESQSEGFNLVDWYKTYGFEEVGSSGAGPVMVYIPEI